MEPFAARPIRFHGVREFGGYRLKDYSIVSQAESVDWLDFARGYEVVLPHLSRPAFARGRPGVGFRIAHQGATGRYAVVAWWANENELPMRIAVRREGGDWRMAEGDESICVWDLHILAFERDAYIETMLASRDLDAAVNEYLKRGYRSG